MTTNNRLRVEEAKKKLQERLAARFEGRRQTAVAVVSSVERDPVSGYTTGKIRATIDGVADQSVFVGAGTGVAVGESLRVENRAGGIGPEWVSLGKTGSVAGSEGTVDTGRPLSTPAGLSLSSSTYAAGTAVAARITVQWNQIGDWEGAANYEIAYYRDADGASNQHVSNAPHVNGQTAVQYAILSLLPGTAYSVKVRAVGYGGSLSSWTATSSHTTATDASVPGAPTGLGANQVSDTALRFYWARSVESDFSHYEIGVSATASTPLLSGYPLATGSTPEHIHNVTPATNRHFRVRAIDTSGNASAWSSFAGPFFTTETVTGSIVLGDIINQGYGLGLLGDPEKIIIDLASSSGLAFEGGTGNLMLADSVAGAGLGISAERELFVGQGAMLAVDDNAVRMKNGTAQYQIPVTGATPFVPDYAALSSFAGDTLDFLDGAFVVNQAFAFEWTAEHTFREDIQLDANLDFLGGTRTVTTANGDLVLAPDGELLLQPVDGITRWQWGAGKSLESSNYTSQETGWGISYGLSGGHADFRSIYANEMHVLAFTADVYQALVGAIIISKSRGRLSRNFTIPADGLTGTLYLEDLEDLADLALFENGDYIRLRVIDSSGGGLIVADVWGVVSGYSNLSGGEQSWTFATTDDGGQAEAVVYAGSIALDYGGTGGVTGIWEATVLDQAGAPYSQVKTWAGNPWTPGNFTTHLRVGNLDGIAGVGAEWGMWVGQNTVTDYLLLSDQHLEAHGLRISLYDGSNETIRLDPVVPSIALGATVPTAFDAPGIWMGRHAADGTYRLSINEDSNQYLQWTWDAGMGRYRLNLAGDIYLNNSQGMGGTNFGGAIHVGDNGLIEMGDGSKISLGAGSFFEMLAGGKAEIGSLGSGNYFGYVDGAMRLEGVLVVSDGGDFLPAKYRPSAISASFILDVEIEGTYLLAAPPYGESVNIAGRMETADGSQYFLYAGTGVLTTASRYFKLAIRKSSSPGQNGSIDTPGTESEYTNVLYVTAWEDGVWAALSQVEKDKRVIIADMYVSADFSEILTLTMRAESSLSIIGPDFIRTPSLEALSIQMGHLQGGKITLTNGSNTLWLNDGTNDIVLAAGTTAGGIAAAKFRLYESGAFRVGDGSNYLDWSGLALTVQGAVKAVTGELVDLSVTGTLSIEDNAEHDSGLYMNGGKIYWNKVGSVYNSYLASDQIHVQDKATGSVLEIGNASLTTGGLIDLEMFQSGATAWRHGISVRDGGNKLDNVSALFHGESDVVWPKEPVDRIFDARTTNDVYSDGYYAEMGDFAGWNNFDTRGVPFKGTHLAGGPVAMFNQQNGGADAPALWVSSDNDNRSIIISEMGRNGQVAFRVIDNGYVGYALWTDGQKIDMGDGRIESMNIINFTTSVSGVPPWTPVVNFGGFSNRTVQRWLRLEVGGTTYQIPLFANGAFM